MQEWNRCKGLDEVCCVFCLTFEQGWQFFQLGVGDSDSERMGTVLQPSASDLEFPQPVTSRDLFLATFIVMPMKQLAIEDLSVNGERNASFAATQNFVALDRPGSAITKGAYRLPIDRGTMAVGAV